MEPPTTSSLVSTPSMITLPPRPSWPAEEITTVFVFVGSKFGAGALPGTRNASSRRLRPLRGGLSPLRGAMTDRERNWRLRDFGSETPGLNAQLIITRRHI